MKRCAQEFEPPSIKHLDSARLKSEAMMPNHKPKNWPDINKVKGSGNENSS